MNFLCLEWFNSIENRLNRYCAKISLIVGITSWSVDSFISVIYATNTISGDPVSHQSMSMIGWWADGGDGMMVYLQIYISNTPKIAIYTKIFTQSKSLKYSWTNASLKSSRSDVMFIGDDDAKLHLSDAKPTRMHVKAINSSSVAILFYCSHIYFRMNRHFEQN